jgi:hypothetical protein
MFDTIIVNSNKVPPRELNSLFISGKGRNNKRAFWLRDDDDDERGIESRHKNYIFQQNDSHLSLIGISE